MLAATTETHFTRRAADGSAASLQFSFEFDEMSGARRLRPLARPVKGAAVGEIPLRSHADGLAPRFTAWRGRSGRRYVATAYPLWSDEALSFEDAVLIAVGADRSILAVRDSGPFGSFEALQNWRLEMAGAGAAQIHVHLIAATAQERRRAVADLDPGGRPAH